MSMDGHERMTAPDGLRPRARRSRAGAGVVLLRIGAALLCLLALLGGGVLGLVVAAGLVALAGGTTALLRGRSRMLPISGRRAGFGVLAAGLATVLIGGSAVGAPHPTPPTGSAPPTALVATPTLRAAAPTATAVPAAATAAATPSHSATPSPSATSSRTAATPPRPAAGTALALLATLPVKGKAPLTGYARTADFGTAWLDVDRNGCDTRNDVLRRDLSATTGTGCRVLTGELHDPYTGRAIAFVRGVRTSTAVQIDHVVALANAWRTGAQKLSPAQRIDLANDPVNLFAVDGPTNEAKSDGDAATWLPPVKAFRCTYVAHQVAVKAAYRLWVTPAERAAMQRVLGACSAMRAPVSTTAHLVPPAGSVRPAPSASATRTSAPAAKPSGPKAGTSSAPPGATAVCRDGTYSYSQHRSGTCSRHGGVARWL
jgi:Protein of unknown function (DUF3761)/Protein of unknown function (DUF1524)